MTHPLIGTAWEHEPPTQDETTLCASWGPTGWQAWNGMSPEVEICELAASLCRMLNPALVIETGVGQGYVTRRLAAVLGTEQKLLAYEEDEVLAGDLAQLPFFAAGPYQRKFIHAGSPGQAEFEAAMLCVLDAELVHREAELQLWMQYAPKHSALLLHDCNPFAPAGTTFVEKAAVVSSLGIPGQFLANPRGGFLGFHP